jgi:hypothetical protein
MSTTEEHDYVSAVFIHLLQPIADLCDRMLQLGCGEPNEVQTSPMENGYAISRDAIKSRCHCNMILPILFHGDVR